MSKSETMTIDLAPETATLVQEAVRSGEFPSAGAMIDAALRTWRAERDDLLGYSMEELRRLGDIGEASGPGRMIDIDEIKREARRLVDSKRTR